MRQSPRLVWAVGLLLLAAAPATAASPFRVVIGSSRDGATQDLQVKVDALLGAGSLDVRSDYVGARAGDPDPWSWANPRAALQIQLVDRKSSHFVIGWYDEAGVSGESDDGLEQVAGGLVLDTGAKRGTRVTFQIPAHVQRFGLFVSDLDDKDERAWFRHRTNRRLNSPGPGGTGALHEPWDGDVQLLVYDVSRWLGHGTWLVAGEISDSGRRVGLDDDESDNDFSDVLFTFSGAGVTPTRPTTFGRVKALFR